ncbi:hypothetical protein TOPH_06473 [Tolypocladium ophioglossoides CBS 100239]|uniref:Uncharacterized protein n=1 Tax=Tolypocladium ophioglossoides (strain CBS 100239) TaxID=1163406 RepID=A0A0L0N4K2_TOLOC|nr:hypothetical protein TOPH_06473 [Tolypocladium ophioglossoides CBS 100239]
MWHLARIFCHFQLWFSDGLPVNVPRGGQNVSSRLIVDQRGFLDVTQVRSDAKLALNANGAVLSLKRKDARGVSCPPLDTGAQWLNLTLTIEDDGGFQLSLCELPKLLRDCYAATEQVSGKLKPLPHIAAEDVEFINEMIEQRYVPYQNIPDAPLKTTEELKALGRQLFPFTPHGFELAMSVYDWTTASFTRLVFMKIFQYTGMAPPPFPLDEKSIAEQIWASNWSSYTPQNADFMRTFLMEPADALEDVRSQLTDVAAELHRFSEVHNRLLSAAFQALPRTAIMSKPQLFSGQVDIYQLGLSHFGIEFLEFPGNNGPVGAELVTGFDDVLASFVSVGKTITTKMVWSFTDSVEDAMHYSNGIVLVANPDDSWVWDKASYITPLSDDPKKTEYTFAPGTQFEVQNIDRATVSDKKVVVITLRPKPRRHVAARREMLDEVARGLRGVLPRVDVVGLVRAHKPSSEPPHSRNKTGGRRCACYRHQG